MKKGRRDHGLPKCPGIVKAYDVFCFEHQATVTGACAAPYPAAEVSRLCPDPAESPAETEEGTLSECPSAEEGQPMAYFLTGG